MPTKEDIALLLEYEMARRRRGLVEIVYLKAVDISLEFLFTDPSDTRCGINAATLLLANMAYGGCAPCFKDIAMKDQEFNELCVDAIQELAPGLKVGATSSDPYLTATSKGVSANISFDGLAIALGNGNGVLGIKWMMELGHLAIDLAFSERDSPAEKFLDIQRGHYGRWPVLCDFYAA